MEITVATPPSALGKAILMAALYELIAKRHNLEDHADEFREGYVAAVLIKRMCRNAKVSFWG